MAFSGSHERGGGGGGGDGFRFRTPHSPHNETTFSAFNAPLRMTASRFPPPTSNTSQTSPTNDARAGLQRRFTTDASKLPTVSSRPATYSPYSTHMDSHDMSSSTMYKIQVEKKQKEYEMLNEERRKIEAKMQMLELQGRQDAQELMRMTEDLEKGHNSTNAGHQSEPTTPPEYRNGGFPNSFSRPNRYSTSSIMSPPGIPNRGNRSGSQLISPLTTISQSEVSNAKMPSKSVPGSRRNSDEHEQDTSWLEEEPVDHRSAATFNRNSMPAAGLGVGARGHASEMASMLGLGQINTTKFLFGDDDPERPSKKDPTSPDVKSYLQMNATDDKFPILVRRDDYPGLLSASSAALDLALSQSPGPESQTDGWPSSFTRHRPAQQSLPYNSLSQMPNSGMNKESSITNRQTRASTGDPRRLIRPSDRNSMDLQTQLQTLGTETRAAAQSATTLTSAPQTTPPKLQTSYSTNDIPTMKSVSNFSPPSSSSNDHAQQHLHKHNASMGRIPASATASKRQSRELSSGEKTPPARDGQQTTYQSLHTSTQPTSPQFGPQPSSPTSNTPTSVTSNAMSPSAMSPTGPSPYGPAGFYGYNMHMLNMGMNGQQMGSPMYGQQAQFQAPNFAMYGYMPRAADTQAVRTMQQRRPVETDANRFANMQLENVRGDIYNLCKDQHGCRYLQKKLEERSPENTHMIFLETNQHVVELMTDPFGNYLCQKLLELATDEEKTTMTNNAAPQLVKIAMNQHGTRALQKMIEHISTAEQIQTIIYALRDRVVELIQDLNGNHVVQKCLNRLSPEDAQFIFDAVGIHCVVVGTHRHGCCVLQRCIDHASGNQKAHLISQISQNAFTLVQDPFGNYVIQYILDLNEWTYTEPLIQCFLGHVTVLSKQKFSSNVIEKCLRTADGSLKQRLIAEMSQPVELEKMLRDSYANYVVQTAMDFADPETKHNLIEAIRPMLPAIRTTPYGRRIQGKIQALDGRSGSNSGQVTPIEGSMPGQLPLGQQTTPKGHHRHSSSGTSPIANGGGSITSPIATNTASSSLETFPIQGATYTIDANAYQPKVHGNGPPAFGPYTTGHTQQFSPQPQQAFSPPQHSHVHQHQPQQHQQHQQQHNPYQPMYNRPSSSQQQQGTPYFF